MATQTEVLDEAWWYALSSRHLQEEASQQSEEKREFWYLHWVLNLRGKHATVDSDIHFAWSFWIENAPYFLSYGLHGYYWKWKEEVTYCFNPWGSFIDWCLCSSPGDTKWSSRRFKKSMEQTGTSVAINSLQFLKALHFLWDKLLSIFTCIFQIQT